MTNYSVVLGAHRGTLGDTRNSVVG